MRQPLSQEYPAWAGYAPADPLPAPVIGDPALPLVSVVTPSLNQGVFLAETIASVLGQDYPNIEHWVIDGGSTDGSLAVLRRHAGDPRLRWVSGPDRGQADAINKGFARCRGAVLAWLNSDDTYLPGAIRRQVAALLANPQAGAVYADAQYIDAAGRPLGRIYARPFSPAALLRLELPAQPTVFLRRGLVGRLGPLDISYRYSMDTAYWARAIRLAPFVPTEGCVATYRLHGASKTVSQPTGFYEEWLRIAEGHFAGSGLTPAARRSRAEVLADIYAAMANMEAQVGRAPGAVRYLAYAMSLAGPRKRMLKLPLALADALLGLGLAARATALWGRLRRGG